MTEIPTVLMGLLANLIGDQILIMLMTGLLHIGGRACASRARSIHENACMTAPDGSLDAPEHNGLSAEQL